MKNSMTMRSKNASFGSWGAAVAFLLLAGSLPANTTEEEALENLPAELVSKAKAGDAEAQFEIGKRLDSGQGVEADPKLAADWYRKAALQGHPKAAEYLAIFYEEGIGVKKDLVLAAKWYELSANKGNANAAKELLRLKNSPSPKPITLSPSQNEAPEKDAAGNPKFVIVTTDKAKIHKEPDMTSDLVANAKWMTPYVVIKRERDGGRWRIRVGEYVSRTEAKPIGWMWQVDLLTDDRAIKNLGIYIKAFPVTRFDDKNDKVAGAKLRNAPGEGGDVIGQEMTQFGIYFVFAENEDLKSGNTYYLMGREPEIFDNQKPEDTILGWVSERRMHRWDTREAAEWDKSTLSERFSGAVYETESDVKKIINGASTKTFKPLFTENTDVKEMKHGDLRYPIISTEYEETGTKYWKVAFVAEGQGTAGASVAKLGGLTQMAPTVDIMIVIDGTTWMNKYGPVIQRAIESTQIAAFDYWRRNHKGKQKPKIRFSVSAYKDYGVPANFRRLPLGDLNKKELEAFLAFSQFTGNGNQPTVLQGLSSSITTAVSEMNPSSFRSLFLIGAAANSGNRNGTEANSLSAVVRMLKTNNIDFHAIHVAGELLDHPLIGEPFSLSLRKFKTQTEAIKNALLKGMSSCAAISNPSKIAAHIQETVIGLIDQRYRTIQEIIAVSTTGNTLIGQRAIQLMKQNGIDPSEFAQKKISPFFEGWVMPFDPLTGKRQLKEVILMEKREVETLISVLDRLVSVLPREIQWGWLKVLSEVAGDDVKVEVNDSPAEIFRKHLGIKVKSGILQKSFHEIGNLPVAEQAEVIKHLQKKLFLLRGVDGEKDIEITEDPKTGRPSYRVRGDKQYWFGHRGSFHAWLDREVYIP
jgi:hypothetical protein